ncbi:protein of unknown function [Taphrina deformans PYCC 5710]|uniref:Uncharacterized protein n=1 Tax=Taphrina deformans (strain PYCC 5710 / ATCC 11124 / CBS 356.35 / IMI 108563 / JCM 9778 / NBRC 8474) TaxID=1097556 RepID=R4XDA8_TAPDE|nr:protein of unknown function [Taphrina deformans PYCC 5710]|eukprot:CCG81324.1 protein of unknown function [Taphrina deformans PYCC 5710]
MVRATVACWQFSHVEIQADKPSAKWRLYNELKSNKQEEDSDDSNGPVFRSRKRRRIDDSIESQGLSAYNDASVKQIEKLQKQIQDLEAALEDEKATSKARKNVNIDQLGRIKKQSEIEQLLRQEIKSVFAEADEATRAAKDLEERLRAENEKYRKELFTLKSTRDDSHHKFTLLEEELKKIKLALAESEGAKQSLNREIRRKEAFISDLHRQGDEQDQKSRLYDKEVDRLKGLVESTERQYWSREREFGAKVSAIHDSNGRLIRDRDQELQTLQKRLKVVEDQRIERLKHQAAALCATQQSFQAQPGGDAGSREATTLPRDNQALSSRAPHPENRTGSDSAVDAKSATLQVGNETVQPATSPSRPTSSGSVPTGNSASTRPTESTTGMGQGGSSTGQAYLKLLRAHELLQKERDLLATKLQDVQQSQTARHHFG